ncbi:hypothetical protein HBH47_237480 [Parastagonospora nodorum]|nr:hypothetical protein HBH47_237480 [Parastagonospora nodorum]
MQINTTNAIFKALAAANKLVALQSYVLGGFIIVCSFRKVDKHIFRAYNTISFNATNKRDSVTSDRIYKIEDAFKTYSSCKVKRFTLNSVKDLFTNLSKDYFLVREARAITKSSLKFQNLSNLCSKLGLREKFSNESILVMQRGITQHEINLKLLAEIYVSIVYFNLDSKLELKVLGKQDVKTTS